MSKPSLSELLNSDEFTQRHIGPNESEQAEMLEHIHFKSLDELSNEILPSDIQFSNDLEITAPNTEADALKELKAIASKNKVFKSYIGMGYHETTVPNVILRNVLENPGWYTAYTPYQPEIAQGRLEALLNYQQMVIDLTGMEMANASLLDEATAAAEAMAMAKRVVKKNKSEVFFVDSSCLPQTIDVVKTRASAFGFEVVVDKAENVADYDIFGALFQYPNMDGSVLNIKELIEKTHSLNAIAAVATDLLALTLLEAPGTFGADIVLGSAQRFGVPMGYGGPHAAFFATRDQFKRAIPGRIIGVSIDSRGKQALRMALQTREQHIRREKANSNICTAQVLLANMAVFYAIYHGPKGLSRIAQRVNRYTSLLAEVLTTHGVKLSTESYFDTLTFQVENTANVISRAEANGYNLRVDSSGTLGLSCHEKTSLHDVKNLASIILGFEVEADFTALDANLTASIPEELTRKTEFLTHSVFNSHHSETEMLRYLRKLESRDLALNHSMISLGSCTMKLNATAEMIPVTWPEFGEIHPFAPQEQVLGYKELLVDLDTKLRAITGFDAISLQPNSGAQGEYAGLLAISKYHESRGEGHRNICLIPQSAHGTNPASAQMASMKVVVTKCDDQGNVDINDLKTKAEQAGENLSCLMITYPSTHGVYESGIKQICNIVHEHGGQVYMDGANLNAQVGLTRPADIGADVSHMNLHKTFAIPHGGGGPGMGPIGVKSHLAPFLSSHPVIPVDNVPNDNGAVSAAPYGSASILPISWMYIHMLGYSGLKKSTQVALLNANYLALRLKGHFPILYSGPKGLVAHECIIDLRPLKAETGITEVDIAKRLMDYGFHAPTMSFPVAGTFMVEPTESEPKSEIDRFADAMIAIRQEIEAIRKGELDSKDNPLTNAPHTMTDIIEGDWKRSYSRELAAFPTKEVKAFKFWPFVNRIDDVYGDRNLICTCPTMEAYEE